LLAACSLLAMARICAGETSTGFGIGPGMAMVEGIKPGGGEVDVAAASGLTFEIENGTNEKHTFSIMVRSAKATVSNWELGYESISDTSWLRLDKKEIELDAKSKGTAKLYINIPDKPENYNRKWMAVVACAPGDKAATGSSVGLMVASRVQIETTPKD